MRIWSVVVGAMFYPALVWGSPVPVPDAGFDGNQYIDGSGCVFSRSEAGWVARTDGSGAQICGFPPTSTLQPVAASDDQPQMAVGERLASLLAEGLRDGEFVGDPRPREERAEPLADPAQDMLQKSIAARIAAGEAARVVAAGAPGESAGLCALLGYRQTVDQKPVLGADVTQGLCPGMRAEPPQARVIADAGAETVGASAENPAMHAAVPTAVADNPAARVRPRQAVAPTHAHKIAPRMSGDLVPAHARYVHVGTFGDDVAFGHALQRLVASGYAAGRSVDQAGKGQQLLAGPFADREELVRALHRLRRGGFSNAVAR